MMIQKLFFLVLFIYIHLSYKIVAQQGIYDDLEQEFKYRKQKKQIEEKYYRNGHLDSVYRKWDHRHNKLTEGYFYNGKKHGSWVEFLSRDRAFNYIKFTYKQGVIKKVYYYEAEGNNVNSPKYYEKLYDFNPDKKNYTRISILWNTNLKNKKKEELFTLVAKGTVTEQYHKFWWSNGNKWEEYYKSLQQDSKGNILRMVNNKKWTTWNKDGTLQRETWYNMGHKLREKRYDHGKLVSDKKY